jgi:hypothetical protein
VITTKDISVVIQGPVNGSPGAAATADVCSSVRRALPEAEIILSTWIGSDTTALERYCDRILLNADPGPVGGGVAKNKFVNVNRQLLSTQMGLAAATRPYAIKTRTDVILTSSRFLELYNRRKDRQRTGRHFAERILVSNVNSPCPTKMPAIFHIGDFFYFGLTNDLRRLWDIDAAPLKLAIWRRLYPAPGKFSRAEEKIAAEQFLLLSFARKVGVDSDPQFCADITLSSYLQSESFLQENFWFLPTKKIGLELPAHLQPLDAPRHCRRDYRLLNHLPAGSMWHKIYTVLRIPVVLAKRQQLRFLHVG